MRVIIAAGKENITKTSSGMAVEFFFWAGAKITPGGNTSSNISFREREGERNRMLCFKAAISLNYAFE